MKNYTILLPAIFVLQTIANSQTYPANVKLFQIDSAFSYFGLNRFKATFETDPGVANVFMRTNSEYLEIKTGDDSLLTFRPLNELVVTHAPIITEFGNFENLFYINIFKYCYENEDVRLKFLDGETLSIRLSLKSRIADDSLSSVDYSSYQTIYSDILTCQIPPPTSADLSAFNYLLSQKDSVQYLEEFLSENNWYGYHHQIPIYDYLIANFPTSALAEIAMLKLSMIKWGNYGSEIELYPDKKLELEQEYVLYTNSKYGFVREKAEALKYLLKI